MATPTSVFDASYYLNQYNDVKQAIILGTFGAGFSTDLDGDGDVDNFDLAQLHYNTNGWAEGRDPNATFDTSYYLQQNADVDAAGINPLAHFQQFGLGEGRAPNASIPTRGDFDADAYLAANADLGAAGLTTAAQAYRHYIEFGQFEGRAAVDTDGNAITPLENDGTSVNDTAQLTGQTFTLTAESAAGADVMRLTGDQDVRIDFTNPANQVTGLDLDGNGVIARDGEENTITGVASDFEIVDAAARNPANETDIQNNFLGDIEFDGTGFEGDGTNTNGNIVLGGLGADTIFGGIGNDFLSGGGVASNAGQDVLSGGRNADFFFTSLSQLSPTDGDNLTIDGGRTSDDAAAGNNTPQDSDWLLLEASDDDEPVVIHLQPVPGGEEAQILSTRSGVSVSMREIENVDASGNLYGFLNDIDTQIGEGAGDDRVTNANLAIGATAQLNVTGSDANNILIGGFDNDLLDGGLGDDLLMGGNLANNNNPNVQNIVNDGRDQLVGGDGEDNLVWEADGGVYEGGAVENQDDAFHDTLWLTNLALGTQSVGGGADGGGLTTDGVLRFDLAVGKVGGIDNAAGYGGADAPASDGLGDHPTADQTNYVEGQARTQTQDMENVNATGLGAVDFLAAGTNDPELNFENQQNAFGLDADLDLRGTRGNATRTIAEDDAGAALDDIDLTDDDDITEVTTIGEDSSERFVDNNLYANTGDDVLEGREGNDNLMGGAGNDDFIFSLGGNNTIISGTQFTEDGGDDLDVIHRLTDADGDNIWDGTYSQDFGLDTASTTGSSSLILTVSETNNPGNELANVTVTEITSVIRDAGGDIAFTLDTPEIRAASTYDELLTAVQDAIAANPDIADSLTATLQGDNTILITDADGRVLEDQAPDAVFGVSGNNTDVSFGMEFGEPEVQVTEDRLIFTAYEDRADGERVDDNAEVGSSISLGTHNYAEDLVVNFADDGTRLAERQQYDILLENLADEDTVTVDVNGVKFSLQVGVALDGTQIANETTAAFATRLAGYINTFLDDDTAAGKIDAAVVAAGTITLTQADYNGAETVFMQRPEVTLDSTRDTGSSGGEAAKATVSNVSASEVHLLDFDGRDGNLNAENVLFWGNQEVNRSVLQTAETAGGVLNGSDAIVVNVDDGDDISASDAQAAFARALDGEIAFNADPNAATPFGDDFAVHGDDQLFGGDGDDVINAGTGDDRVYGSRGDDTLDGGKDLYLVDGVIQVLNNYEALQVDADPNVVSIEQIRQTEVSGFLKPLASGGQTFADTLILQQGDFGTVGLGGAQFTITLDGDVDFPEGGAGTVTVVEDTNGDGVVDTVTGNTRFTNFENVRTVSGDGTLAGQGQDTLDAQNLSDGNGGIRYYLDGSVNAGLVQVDADTDDMAGTSVAFETEQRDFQDFFRVDGVENVIGGTGEDVLVIDETEAGKNNVFTAGAGRDAVQYDHETGLSATERPDVTLTLNTDPDTDTLGMTNGLVGLDNPVDTLVSVEIIDIEEAATSSRADDVLDVTNVTDAVVDFVNSEVRSNGELVVNTNVVADIIGMSQFETVNADFADTVIVADTMTNDNTNESIDDADLTFDSFLNYDLLDERGTDPVRLSVGELRAIATGTADTKTEDDIPQAENIGLFTFNMGPDNDTVDYSNETGTVAAVANFDDATSISVNNVLVSDDNDDDFIDGVIAANGNRVDAITGNENLVASQGNSIIDLTQATGGLKVRFNADDGVTENVAALDRDVFRVQISELDTTQPITGMNFLSYQDAGDDAGVFQATAEWNTVEGSDNNIMVELTDRETASNHTFNLRGGDNEVNYNELTRSIETEITVIGTAGTSDHQIEATTTFTDGNAGTIGGTDVVTTHTAQNAISAGSLRIEASQDAEDSLSFTGGLAKFFLLGEVVDGSDQITVTLDDAGNENSMVVTGYEILRDADTDDVYSLSDLDRVLNNLTLEDNGTDDQDTLMVEDDAVGFQGAAADTINLEELNNDFNFDFDVLDITNVTSNGLTIIGDADTTVTTRDNHNDGGDPEVLILGDLDLVDDVQLFDSLALTDASVVSSGSTFDLDMTAGELQDAGDGTLFTLDNTTIDTLDASRITSNLTLTVTGGTGSTVIGGQGDDTITGGAGNDVIIGGAGDDQLEGGIGTEVREFNLAGILAADGNNATFDFMSQGNIGLTEGVDFVSGAGNDAVGTALANALDGNLVQVNLDFVAGGGTQEIIDVSYDTGTDLLTFTFAAGADEGTAIDLGYAANADGGTFAISAENTVTDGSDGGNDTFDFEGNGTGQDVISGFATTADTLSFDGIGVTGGGAITATAGTAVTAGIVVAGALANDTVYVINDGATSLTGGTESITDYTNLADVAAYLGEGYTSTADDDAAVFVINDLAGARTYVYLFDEQTDGASTIQAADLALIGSVDEINDAPIVDGDIA